MAQIRDNINALQALLAARRERDVAGFTRSAVALRRLTMMGAAAIVGSPSWRWSPRPATPGR